MDKLIEVKVNGSYITKDSNVAGVQGEANATTLRIEFDPSWDGLVKKVVFWDVYGQNPVERTLTVDLLEDITKSTRIYRCPIPGEPLVHPGKCSFSIEGYVNGKRQRSLEEKLLVKESGVADHTGQPVDPSPTQAEQIQGQIENMVGEIREAMVARDEAKTSAEAAAKSAEAAYDSERFAKGYLQDTKNAMERAESAADKASTARSEAQASAQAAGTAAAAAEAAAGNAAANVESLLAQHVQDSQAAKNAAESASAAAAGSASAAAQSAQAAQQAAGSAAQQAAQGVENLLVQHVNQSTAAKNAAQQAATAAAGSATNAAASEEAARQYAETINPEAIDAKINAKGDNLEFDNETNLLYLVSGGERIGDGIKVATSGGGGGGGESNNAVLTLKNTSGWTYKNISVGASCPFGFEWSSLEDGMETGAGVLKITVAGTVKHQGQIPQGSNTVDIGPYLPAGTSQVKVNVTDVYGNSRSLVLNLTAVELTLTSPFDDSVVYTEGVINFPYVPTGTVTKTMHFAINGVEQPTVDVATSGRQQTFSYVPPLHGAHRLEAWFTGVVDGQEVPSNRLQYTILHAEAGNTKPIVAVDLWDFEAEQYDNVVIPYRVYDPAGLTAKVKLYSSETQQTLERTVDRTWQTWNYRPVTAGDVELSLSCEGADTTQGTTLTDLVTFTLAVKEAQMDVAAETEGLSLHLTSYGRSNSEAEPSGWSYGDVAASLTGFNFTSDGWLQDEDGITVLRVGGDARVEIPVQMFAKDFRTTGKTIEIEFASRSVLDYDAVIATCWTGERGLEITAQQAILKSEKSEVSTRYKEDDHLRLSFVIEKRSGNRLIIGYVNGIISGMVQYPDNDDFSQAVPVNITLGSNDCTIDIYNIRVYESDLTRHQMLDNWIADTQDPGLRKDRYDRNNVFDDYGQILPATLRPHQCYLILNCPVLPTYKGDKKTCSGSYVDPVDTKRSFTFEGAEIDVQGTSSQYYYVKNFKIKFKGGFTRDGRTAETYAMNDNAVPTNEFTFKADVASSEGANNVVLAELYNDLCPVKTPAQEEDPRVRQTIEGHPIVVFHDDGSGAKFIGKYNFNNDKGTAEVFGFVEGDESWEIKENGNAQVSFKTDDFTGWETSFEARYPDKYTDISRLQAFVAWVASTNTEGQSESEKAARLAKFKDELSQWADVEDAIFYYLFTLVFLCIDQREKNAFPTWNAEMGKWLWLFYDADSSLGTDNKGNLTFEYWMEDVDFTEAGDPVFNGQNNVFWSNLRVCFADEIRDMYRSLRTEIGADGKALLSYDKVNALFEAHQSQWSEAIFNEDAWRKAVEPLEKVGDPQYLPMQQGKKEQHFKHFMYNRLRYLDSKFETGAALDEENRIMMRAHAQGNIWLTSYINMYGQVYYNSAKDEHRMVRDQAYEFQWKAEGGEDAVIGVNSAPMITSLGDLAPLKLEYCHIQYAEHLTELKVGDAGYVNDNLVALTLGNNRLLRKLDVRNCTNLTQTVDASGCTNIEEVYFEGSSISGLALPNGGILKVLHLPGTITDLTIRNQPKLTDFSLAGYGNITTLWLEGVPDVVPMDDILGAIPANSRVRLVGFDRTFESAEEVLTFYDFLDTMRGLDENGNNLDKAQVSGTVRVDSVTGGQLAEMKARYPAINVVYAHITSYLYFYNDDGTKLLYTATVADGGDGSYGGSTPTKTSTAQYSYSFSGSWATTPGGAANADALKNVTADRSVYAVFTATVRTYTVYWKNGSTTLETDKNVPYGTKPTYNGSTPVDGTNGMPFIGWTPAVGPITGNTTYTAEFEPFVQDVEIDESWYTILKNIVNNRYRSKYRIGNYKPLDLGAEGVINMQIAAFDTDDLADGSGKAPVTFIAKELLANKRAWNPSLVTNADGSYQEGTGVIGGWEKSAIRSHINGILKPTFPANVQSRIVSVLKNQNSLDVSGVLCPQTTTDDVWLLSEEEVYVSQNKHVYANIFPDKTSRFRCLAGTTEPVSWNLRSARKTSGATSPNAILADGSVWPVGLTSGVCLGFCIGVKEIADDWSTIIASVHDGTYAGKYQVGDWKAIDLGEHGVIRMQIAAFDRDDLADGSGKAPITWVAQNLLAGTQTGRSYPVWSSSGDRSYLQNTILPLIPAEIRGSIASVQKKHLRQHSGGSSTEGVYEMETTTDEIWLLSAAEVGIGSQSSGWATHYAATGEPYDLFASENCTRVKKLAGGDAAAWSLRDAAVYWPAGSVMVTDEGDWDSNEGSVGMLIGFCMK